MLCSDDVLVAMRTGQTSRSTGECPVCQITTIFVPPSFLLQPTAILSGKLLY